MNRPKKKKRVFDSYLLQDMMRVASRPQQQEGGTGRGDGRPLQMQGSVDQKAKEDAAQKGRYRPVHALDGDEHVGDQNNITR
jgi:hypothetical protein